MFFTLMAEHFKYYPSDEEVVTPWNARYSYPSQANKSTKSTPRIPPKNGNSFQPGNVIRLEFPAQGYVNPLNTMLEFDVVLFAPQNSGAYAVRFQNNIQSIFNRVRLLYGASPQEDLLQYNVLVRCLTEWTGCSTMQSIDRSAITDGIGGVCIGSHQSNLGVTATSTANSLTTGPDGSKALRVAVANGTSTFPVGSLVTITGGGEGVDGVQQVVSGDTSHIDFYTGVSANAQVGLVVSFLSSAVSNVNVRQTYIQGAEGQFSGELDPSLRTMFDNVNGHGAGVVPNNSVSGLLPGGIQPLATNPIFSVRRYCVNLALGIFTQDKLIPTKYMASQLAIEITLEQASACIYQPIGFSTNTSAPTYAVGNVNLLPEMIDFDDTYDQEFLKGLETGGIPIKFSTWHYFSFTTQGSSYLQLQISERSRSVKGMFAVQRRAPAGFQYDSHACFYDTNPSTRAYTGSTMQEYQVRMGGRYFPGAPVQCSAGIGSPISNGGAEAYIELEKFLNIVGDYRLPTSTTPRNWAVPASIDRIANTLPEYDFSMEVINYSMHGIPRNYVLESSKSSYCGTAPSSMFACAINFETSNGVEISGLNAEEQSDISLNIRWSSNQSSGFSVEVFTYVDVMWVLRPNNYLDLIQ